MRLGQADAASGPLQQLSLLPSPELQFLKELPVVWTQDKCPQRSPVEISATEFPLHWLVLNSSMCWL